MWYEFIASLRNNIVQIEAYQFWILATILSSVSLLFFLRMIRWWNHSRMIEDVPTSRVRSASQGHVELVGYARMMDGPVIVSPLSRKSCVWYRYKIEEKITSRDTKGNSRSYLARRKTSNQ